MFFIDSPSISSQPLLSGRYLYSNEICVGYSNEPYSKFEILPDNQLTMMAMSLAQSSLASTWNLEDTEEDDFWASFLNDEEG